MKKLFAFLALLVCLLSAPPEAYSANFTKGKEYYIDASVCSWFFDASAIIKVWDGSNNVVCDRVTPKIVKFVPTNSVSRIYIKRLDPKNENNLWTEIVAEAPTNTSNNCIKIDNDSKVSYSTFSPDIWLISKNINNWSADAVSSYKLNLNASTGVYTVNVPAEKLIASGVDNGFKIGFGDLKEWDYYYGSSSESAETLSIDSPVSVKKKGGGNLCIPSTVTGDVTITFNTKTNQVTASWSVEPTTYKCSVDFSRLATDGWTDSNIHAFFKDANGDFNDCSWPGIEPKSVDNGVATFEYTTTSIPTVVVFNNGKGDGRNQSIDLTFSNNKLYTLRRSIDDNDPNARSLTPVTAATNIQIHGTDFNIIKSDNTTVGAGWGNNADRRMTWDSDNQWFYIDIKPTSKTINYKFFTNETTIENVSPSYGYLSTNNAISVSPSMENLDWTAHFSNDALGNNNNMLIELSTAYSYRVFLRQCEHGHLQYAIARIPTGEEQTYTVMLDLSQMGSRKWSKACVYPTDGSFAWPGIEGTISNNIATFTFKSEFAPSKIVFNNGSGDSMNETAKTAKTAEADFKNKGTYKIIYDFNQDPNWIFADNKELQEKVNLPYGPADFDEPRYFLVGARMGRWRLQPEWELLKQDDGTYMIDGGRYMFHGNFAVARVRTYSGYVRNQYELVSSTSTTFDKDHLKNDEKFPLQRVEFGTNDFGCSYDKFDVNKVPHLTNATGTALTNFQQEAMLFAYDGTTNTKDKLSYNDGEDTEKKYNIGLSNADKGTWVSSIILSPSSLGDVAFNLQFVIGDPTNIDNRVFTLVGSEIKNKETDPNVSKKKTLRSERNGDNGIPSWQEAWIQYDEKGNPYYDAESHYLYHTAYTPKVLNNSYVKFGINVDNEEFEYNAAAVTFVEANQLSDLNNDPYRELYKFFEGNKKLYTGMPVQNISPEAKAAGTDFDFKLGEVNADYNKDGYNDWKVFVIRDAWVKDKFKIWNGWGGCSLRDEGFGYPKEEDGSRWNQLNAGPKGQQATDMQITKIHAGSADSNDGQPITQLFTNEGSGSDWQTQDNALTYYNRIILLYNVGQTDALANSLVMFIQDDAQPVIKAFVRGNDKNQARYEWNLVNVNASAGEYVKSFVVTRNYRASDGKVYTKVVQTKTLENLISVNDFTTVSDLTRFTDPDVLNPGTYYYNIKVTVSDENGNNPDVREANSNRFVIFSENFTPELSIMQLVNLTQKGYEAITKADTNFPTLKKKIEDFKVAAYANPADINTFYANRFFLTYREKDESVPYYAIYAGLSEDGMNRNVNYMSEVPYQEVIDFFREPLNYMWASRFYVRALDYTDFVADIANMGATIEDLEIKLTDVEAAKLTDSFESIENVEWQTSSRNIATTRYTVKPLNTTRTREYMGAIVDRAGFLGAGDMEATMTYKLEGYDKATTVTDTKFFQPVVPEPFDLTYHYEYRTTEFGEPIKEKAKNEVPEGITISDWDKVNTFLQVETTSRYVKDKDGNFEKRTLLIPEKNVANERYLDCVFEFMRPNVSKEILKHYDIRYTLHMKTVAADDAKPEDLLGVDLDGQNFGGTYYDDSQIESQDIEDENGNITTVDLNTRPAYRVVIKNTHPSGKVYPVFNITSTVYQRRYDFGGENYRLAADYKYDDLHLVGKNNPTSTKLAGDFRLDLNTLHIKYDEKEGKKGPRWYITGHRDFKFSGNPTPDLGDPDDDKNNGIDTDTFADTELYMIELTNKAGNTIYQPYLWAHNDDQYATTTKKFKDLDYKMEDNPYFIGNLETESKDPETGVGENEVPKLTVTPVFLFIRDLTPETNGYSANRVLVDLKPVMDESTPSGVRAKVMRRADSTSNTIFTPRDDRKVEFIYSDAEKTNVIGAYYDTTGTHIDKEGNEVPDHPELVTMPTTANNFVPAADAITGIEGVAADGAGDAEAVYYNLQGIRIEKPAKGQIYIRQIGNISEKVLF